MDYRPYAVQVVNWGHDDLYIDYLTLTREDSFPGGRTEKYQWGIDGGKGWVLSENGNAVNNWRGKTNQDRAYNSYTFPVDNGDGAGWDVSCRKNNGYCEHIQVTYELTMDAQHMYMRGEGSGDGIEVHVDGQLKCECLDCDSCLLLIYYLYLTSTLDAFAFAQTLLVSPVKITLYPNSINTNILL